MSAAFADDVEALANAARALVERARAIAELRRGRGLGATSIQRLDELNAALGDLRNALVELRPEADAEAAERERERFERLRSQTRV